MSEENSTDGEDVPQQPVQLFDWKRFGYMFMAILTLMVFIDSDLRSSLGNAIGTPLFALVGFDGQYPLLTLVLAGTIMIVFSTVVRDFLVDWVEMAEIQKKLAAFNKENMDAKMNNKTTKLKKLEKIQPEVAAMQMKSMKPQFKSMILTMIVFITVFAALYTFVADLPNTTYAVPWARNLNLENRFLLFPQWVMVYMVVSIPVGQLIRVSLQMLNYSRRIKEEEEISWTGS